MKYEVRYRGQGLNVPLKDFDDMGEAQRYATKCNDERNEFYDLLSNEGIMPEEEYEEKYTLLSKNATNDFVHSGGTFHAVKVEAELSAKQKKASALKAKADAMAPWDVMHCPICEKERMRGTPNISVFCSQKCERAYNKLMRGEEK